EQEILGSAVREVVRKQAEIGLDVISDGEFGKNISWSQYVLERLDGFERRPLPADAEDPFAKGADRVRFPEFYAELDAHAARSAAGDWGSVKSESVCVAPIVYTGQAALLRDIEHFKNALSQVD